MRTKNEIRDEITGRRNQLARYKKEMESLPFRIELVFEAIQDLEAELQQVKREEKQNH